MSSRGQRCRTLASCLFLLAGGSSCRRDQADSDAPSPLPAAEEKEPTSVLVFPEQLRIDDESVNRFVARAMTTCASGEYDAFRLLWSAREQPLPRSEYERGWQAVRKIQIRLVQKVELTQAPHKGSADTQPTDAEPETAYVLYAAVHLDPTFQAGRRKSDRDVILLIRKEQQSWRLARANKKMRGWIKKKMQASGR